MFQLKSDSKGDYFYRKTMPVITLEDMIESIDYFEKGDNLPEKLRIIEDSRDVKVNFSIKDIPAIMQKVSKVSEKFDIVRHAIIYNSPVYTAYGLLAENLISNKKYFLKSFSSVSAAKEWLEIDDSL